MARAPACGADAAAADTWNAGATSFKEQKAADGTSSHFLQFSLGPAARRFLLAKLKPRLSASLGAHGLSWEEVQPALELIDSAEELREALEQPEAFLRRLAPELASAMGPAAKRFLLAKLKMPKAIAL